MILRSWCTKNPTPSPLAWDITEACVCTTSQNFPLVFPAPNSGDCLANASFIGCLPPPPSPSSTISVSCTFQIKPLHSDSYLRICCTLLSAFTYDILFDPFDPYNSGREEVIFIRASNWMWAPYSVTFSPVSWEQYLAHYRSLTNNWWIKGETDAPISNFYQITK